MQHIPRGLPPLTVGRWAPPAAPLGDMLVVCVTITLVGLMESIAIAKSLADVHRHELDPSQELLGARSIRLAELLLQDEGHVHNCHASLGGGHHRCPDDAAPLQIRYTLCVLSSRYFDKRVWHLCTVAALWT